jgi:hypothetical protein
MQESNLDVNLIIQTFQEKLSQLTTDLVVKEATIKQLNLVIQELQSHTHDDGFSTPVESTPVNQISKKDK